jgi:hypothetical protein
MKRRALLRPSELAPVRMSALPALPVLSALPAFMLMLALSSAGTAGTAVAAGTARLDAKFSCSAEPAGARLRDGDRRLYADSAEMHLRGSVIEAFRWESSLFRSTHGFDCSIDEGDGLEAEALPAQGAGEQRWRIRLQDGAAARTRRGYDSEHGLDCSIGLTQRGNRLQITPLCPALCGSRENFSALTVDLQTGQCDYEH